MKIHSTELAVALLLAVVGDLVSSPNNVADIVRLLAWAVFVQESFLYCTNTALMESQVLR